MAVGHMHWHEYDFFLVLVFTFYSLTTSPQYASDSATDVTLRFLLVCSYCYNIDIALLQKVYYD